MKPHQILLYMISVFVFLGLIILIFPKDGISITEDIKLEFTTFEEVFEPQEINYKDISGIINLNEHDSVQYNYKKELFRNVFVKDPFEFKVVATLADTVSIDVAEVGKVLQKIEYPSGDPSIFYNFFRALKEEAKKDVIRILHYGDSQLEGDRITSFIRNQLQRQFGGGGPGLLPALQPYNYGTTIKHQIAGPWRRYNTREHSKTLDGKRFGVLAGVSRFSPLYYTPKVKADDPNNEMNEVIINRDTSALTQANEKLKVIRDTNAVKKDPVEKKKITPQVQKNKTYEATVTFKRSKRAYKTNYYFDQCRLFYGYNQASVSTYVHENDSLIHKAVLPSNQSLQVKQWAVNQPEKLMLKFIGADSPEIYGIALDATTGVAVDNIPMRGSAGLMFTRMNTDLLKDMLYALNVKMVILQFGGNVTPYITSDYGYYQRMFSKQIQILRAVKPDLAILVIGPADMSRKVGGHYESYPNIPAIRDVLKDAAFENGAAFWDMYQAMGGKNSMPSWVMADPPLASKDFIHFTRKGAEIVSRMFYNALISEYNHFLYKHTK